METSLFIAKILGLCFLIVAVGIMCNRTFYQRVMEDYCKNTFLILFGGMLALIIGLIIVLTHNVWVARWPVIITIYGWGGVIKGVWLIVFPNTVYGFMQAFIRNKILVSVHSVLVIALGTFLTYFGYFAGK